MRLLVSALSCNPAIGSEALVGFKYAEALAQRHEVIVLASPPSETPKGARLEICDAGPCSFNEVGPVPLLRFEWRQLRMGRQLASGVDLVHRITPGSVDIPTWAFRLGKPLIIGPLIGARRPPPDFESFLKRPSSPHTRGRLHPSRLAARVCRAIVGRNGRRGTHLHRAKRILVGTRTAQGMLPESCRAKSRLITYSGVEHEIFSPVSARSSNENVVRLLYVGRLVPYKGPELLIHAFARAAKKVPVHLTILGTGDPVYVDYLIQQTRELGLYIDRPSGEHPASSIQHPASGIRFLPPLPRAELPTMYQSADIFCFPTLCDTYGIALLEAMSCGCAAVATDIAGAGEIVDGRNGLKVPLQNPEQYITAFSKTIVALAQNSERRTQIGAAARKYILEQHDWGRIGEHLLAIYDEFDRSADSPVCVS
jgi:glycosyltransferase involved in cell wall biosynthesis